MRNGIPFTSLLLLALACGPPSSDTIQLRIRGNSGLPLSAAAIRYQPADNVLSARLNPQGGLAIERRDSSRALTVHIPEACPVTLPPGPQPAVVEVRPLIDLGPERAPVGFDQPFEVSARHGCPQRGRGRITWRQVEGAPVSLSVANDGFTLRARTPRFELVHPEPLPDGIVPISPRTQGKVVLEAQWSGPGFAPTSRRVTVRATSRATGVSSVAVSQQLLLSGAGWRVQHAPQNGHARVHAAGVVSMFSPDAPGRWALEDARGKTLGVQAFWHDKTPYDCGRSECHGAIAQSAEHSPMSYALERQLDTGAAVSCMVECHTLGEPGLHDGGFSAVASELGWTWLNDARWQDLPQGLRRLGGVRCTACHGPGAIPEPGARALVLRSDVCATCHDAPPKYLHVAQWRASRMARSDAAPSTRTGSCARCHTTAGFLTSLGASPPRELEPAGIACAACHAPHAHDSGPRLIRSVHAVDTEQLEPRTALCVACHAPVAGESQPSASSATLWLGRAVIPAAEGGGSEEIRGAAVHRTVPGGCVGCHGGTPAVDHSFRVAAEGCKSCHRESDPIARWKDAQRSLDLRVAGLMQTLEQQCPSGPVRATSGPEHAMADRVACPSQRLERARYALHLVSEDRAAAVHSGTFAGVLLDDVERQLSLTVR